MEADDSSVRPGRSLDLTASSSCYVATGAIILQGATVGDHVRIGVGAIVYAGSFVPDEPGMTLRTHAARSSLLAARYPLLGSNGISCTRM